MKKLIYLVFVLVSGACSKDERPAQSSIKDTRNVQLKGMTSDGLPSPYFQFTYDTNRYITRIEHAAGLLQYELQYEKGRLVRMASNTPLNKDTLIYRYESNTLSRVDLVDINGRKIKEAELSYDPQNRLKEIRWNEVKADFSSLPTRKLVFSYDNRNNISSFEDFRNSGHGLKLVQTHFYDKYDDKINPESNFIVKDVFEHFLFLPQVQLQRNNPLSERITGGQNDWTIAYSYAFKDGLPVRKSAALQPAGGTLGGVITVNSTYTY